MMLAFFLLFFVNNSFISKINYTFVKNIPQFNVSLRFGLYFSYNRLDIFSAFSSKCTLYLRIQYGYVERDAA